MTSTLVKYDPDQPRDAEGRWDDLGGGDGGKPTGFSGPFRGWSTYSAADQSDLHAYAQGHPAYPINNALRAGQPVPAEHQAMVQRLDHAIAQNAIARPTTVMRGIDDPSYLPPVGGRYTESGYTSTLTGDSDVYALRDSIHDVYPEGTVQIELPTGTNAALPTIDDQVRMGIDPNEGQELILPRGTEFQRMPDIREEGQTIIHLAVVPARAAKAFSDDEPRDERGRWTDGGGDDERKVLYHGTTVSNAEGIMRNGLRPPYGGNIPTGEISPNVTTSRAEAIGWAQRRAGYGSRAAVVTVRLPDEKLDEHLRGSQRRYEVAKTIPPEYLSVETIAPDSSAEDRKVWRPRLVKYSEDEARDERGRWTDGGDSGEYKIEGGNATKARLAALDKELTEQGLHPEHPLRGVIGDSWKGQLAVVRDANGRIVGALAYQRATNDHPVTHLTDLRTLGTEQGKGVGQALMQYAAQDALTKKDGEVALSGAVQTAIPFYQKMGATFRAVPGDEFRNEPAHFSSYGTIEGDNLRALAAGKPNNLTISAVDAVEKENADFRARYPAYEQAPKEGDERNKPVNQQAYVPDIVAVPEPKAWRPTLVKDWQDQPRVPAGQPGGGEFGSGDGGSAQTVSGLKASDYPSGNLPTRLTEPEVAGRYSATTSPGAEREQQMRVNFANALKERDPAMRVPTSVIKGMLTGSTPREFQNQHENGVSKAAAGMKDYYDARRYRLESEGQGYPSHEAPDPNHPGYRTQAPELSPDKYPVYGYMAPKGGADFLDPSKPEDVQTALSYITNAYLAPGSTTPAAGDWTRQMAEVNAHPDSYAWEVTPSRFNSGEGDYASVVKLEGTEGKMVSLESQASRMSDSELAGTKLYPLGDGKGNLNGSVITAIANKEWGANQYGDAQVIFKPDVLKNATVTDGDSIDNARIALPYSVASNPDNKAPIMDTASDFTFQSSDYRTGDEQRFQNGGKFASPTFPASAGYIETQYGSPHPGLADIQEIRFTGAKPTAAMRKEMAAEGIQWSYSPAPSLRGQATSLGDYLDMKGDGIKNPLNKATVQPFPQSAVVATRGAQALVRTTGDKARVYDSSDGLFGPETSIQAALKQGYWDHVTTDQPAKVWRPRLVKYSEDQPRVPAGEPGGGEFEGDGGGGVATATKPWEEMHTGPTIGSGYRRDMYDSLAPASYAVRHSLVEPNPNRTPEQNAEIAQRETEMRLCHLYQDFSPGCDIVKTAMDHEVTADEVTRWRGGNTSSVKTVDEPGQVSEFVDLTLGHSPLTAQDLADDANAAAAYLTQETRDAGPVDKELYRALITDPSQFKVGETVTLGRAQSFTGRIKSAADAIGRATEMGLRGEDRPLSSTSKVILDVAPGSKAYRLPTGMSDEYLAGGTYRVNSIENVRHLDDPAYEGVKLSANDRWALSGATYVHLEQVSGLKRKARSIDHLFDATPFPRARLTTRKAWRPRLVKYSEDQARDDHGRWTDGGGGLEPQKWQTTGTTDDQREAGYRFASHAFDPPFEPNNTWKPTPHLTREQQDALDTYKGSGYRWMNEALRGDKTLDEYDQKQVDALKSAIESSTTAEPMVVFRGFYAQTLPDGSRETPDWKVGDTLTDKGFTSGSLSQRQALTFTDEQTHIMEITVPKGSSALPSYGEGEVILPPGSSFKLTSIDSDTPSWRTDYGPPTTDAGRNFPAPTVYHMTLLPGAAAKRYGGTLVSMKDSRFVVSESDLIHTPARADKAYSEDQPRDDHGRWTSDGAGDAADKPSGGPLVGGSDKPADYDPADPTTAFPAGPMRDQMREMQERFTNPKPWDPAIVLGGPEMVPQRDIAAYLKDHGQEWTAQKLPEGIDRGPAHECYMNATHAVMDDPTHLRYCEGYVTDPEAAGFSFMHGWAVTEDGKVIDPTLPHPENCTYWGVAYDTDQYMRYIQSTKVFGVLGGTEEGARAVIARGGLP